MDENIKHKTTSSNDEIIPNTNLNNDINNEISDSNYFEKFGIPKNSNEVDHEIFQAIRKRLFSYFDDRGHPYKPNKYEYRASSIGYCSRKIILSKYPEKYLNDEQLIRLQTIDESPLKLGSHIAGQMIHETIQEALKADIHSIEQEVDMKIGNARIVGHYDILIEKNNERIVIDIKSTGSSRKNLPKKAHLTQLMAYQGMMKGIRGALLYVNRTNWELSYFPQEFNRDSFSKIIKKVMQLSRHENENTLPPAIPEDEFECEYYNYRCDFYDFCFPDTSKLDNSKK